MSLNALRWSGRPGHAEVWYVTAIDPAQGLGVWLRYTILAPREGPATASLWAFVSERAEVVAMARDEYPISASRFFDDPGFAVSIGDARLDEQGASGRVGQGPESISWDLEFGPAEHRFEHIDPRLYRLGVTKSVVNSARLAMKVSGELRWGDRSVALCAVAGQQSHVYGRRPTDHYAWAHCNAFAEDPEAVFEGLSARVRSAGLRLPQAGPLLLAGSGYRFELRDPLRVFLVKGQQRYGAWSFEAQSDDQILVGRVEAPREGFVAVEYQDSLGGPPIYCHNTLFAELELELYRRRRGPGVGWELSRRLQSGPCAAFEVCRVERDPAAGSGLRLSAARRVTP